MTLSLLCKYAIRCTIQDPLCCRSSAQTISIGIIDNPDNIMRYFITQSSQPLFFSTSTLHFHINTRLWGPWGVIMRASCAKSVPVSIGYSITGKKIEVILAFQIAKIREAVPKTHNHVDPSTICTHFNTFCFLRYIIKSVFSLLYNTF
jgi:hypothetical protein